MQCSCSDLVGLNLNRRSLESREGNPTSPLGMGGLRVSFWPLLFFSFNSINPFFPSGEGLPSPYPLPGLLLAPVGGIT